MKPTISLTLLLLVHSTFAGTLTEDFGDDNLHGWRRLEGRIGPNGVTDSSADWYIDRGELVVESNRCQQVTVLGLGDRAWDDYELDCQFKVEPFDVRPACGLPPLFGIGVRYDDRNGIVSGATLVGQWDGQSWRVPMCQLFFEVGITMKVRQVDVPIDMGRWHRVQFIVRGEQYMAFLDERPICRFRSAVLEKRGAIVFFARNGKFHFDNIDVTGGRIPEVDMNALSVSPTVKLTTTWAHIKEGSRH